jgi:hypothetical protein
LEHFKKLQGNLEFHQNKYHPGDIPDMRRQCAKATKQWTQGMGGRRPARYYVCLARGFMHTCLHEKGKAKVVEKVGGGQITWPTDDVARPVGHHLVSYQLNQVGNPSLDPYKYPSPGGNQNTHHILEIPLAKHPFLV